MTTDTRGRLLDALENSPLGEQLRTEAEAGDLAERLALLDEIAAIDAERKIGPSAELLEAVNQAHERVKAAAAALDRARNELVDAESASTANLSVLARRRDECTRRLVEKAPRCLVEFAQELRRLTSEPRGISARWAEAHRLRVHVLPGLYLEPLAERDMAERIDQLRAGIPGAGVQIATT